MDEIAFDPFTSAHRADPGVVFAGLREASPVHYFAPRNFYALSRYADVLEVLREPIQWSVAQGPGPERTPSPEPSVLLLADPPDHTRQRRLVQSAFLPHALAPLAARIERTAHDQIDTFVQAGEADLMQAFAYPLPLNVILEFLGIPLERQAEFKDWSRRIQARVHGNREMAASGVAARAEMAAYFAHEIEQPLRPGLVNDLATGTQLTGPELCNIFVQVLVAGHETTTALIGNLVYQLLTHPRELARLQADPSLAERAVEESLRLDSPIQGVFRTNGSAVDLHGVHIPANTKLWALCASANRDPTVFDAPEEFHIDREPPALRQHLAFGHGVHHCLGAPLARLEASIALRALLERLPNLRLDGQPELLDELILRGFRRLPVAWDPT
jgi:cytochrome P450